jgi:hypothetical protein
VEAAPRRDLLGQISGSHTDKAAYRADFRPDNIVGVMSRGSGEIVHAHCERQGRSSLQGKDKWHGEIMLRGLPNSTRHPRRRLYASTG